ncbi:type II and III secretion system protein family protein [Jejubacter sp. L23]|uniref:type II and III secretion system protein family protein n=1 Tax=Jejubacter sp. L23 TaxID=3092086 RepID=UPI003D762F4A
MGNQQRKNNQIKIDNLYLTGSGDNMLRLFRNLLATFFLVVSSAAGAGEIWIQPGDSRVIQLQENIDTVFVSAPDVVEYEIIGDKSLVAYGKEFGRSELIAFNKNGEQVLKTLIIVDAILGEAHQRISEEFPDSKVTIKKMAGTYILSGTAESEEAKDRIYQIVGESIGAKKTVLERTLIKNGNGGGDKNDERLPWMDQVLYEGLINKLQLPITNQVNVKLSIVEVTREFTDNIGVDWNTVGETASGMFRLVKFDANSITSLIHAISNDSVARVLAEPNLSVLSGETAEFLVGGEVPVVTTSNNGTSVDYKEYGIKLNIGAKVNNNKKIRVILGQEVSNLDSTYTTVAGSSIPALQTRRARTTVELADGESFLLGGLISKTEQEQLAKIPFVGDIPILGALFRNASTERKNKELVVIATVNLVKPVATREIVVPEFRTTTTWSRLFNLDGITSRRDKERAVNFIERGGFIK